MWGNIILLTYEHLHQPVRFPCVRWMKQITGRVSARPGTLRTRLWAACAEGMGGSSARRGRAGYHSRYPRGSGGQGEEEGATPQEAELERATNGKKQGLNLRSRIAPLCRTGNVIPEEGLTQSQRRSPAVVSKRAAV